LLFSAKFAAFAAAFGRGTGETALFELVKQFECMVLEVANETNFNITGDGSNDDNMSQLDDEAVQLAWDKYHQTSMALRRKGGRSLFAKHSQHQHSMECLVGACCYCFIFTKMSTYTYAELFGDKFGPALDTASNKLRHLLFKTQFLQRVAIKVHTFLQQESFCKGALFHLDAKQPTLDFGQRFSQLYLQEQIVIEQQNDCARWQWREDEKLRRKNEIKRLRQEIADLDEAVRVKKREVLALNASMPPKTIYRTVKKLHKISRAGNHLSHEYRDVEEAYTNQEWTLQQNRVRIVESAIRDLESRIQGKNREIVALQKKIDPIMSPLPEDSAKREQVLFALYMPKDLRILSNMTCSVEAAFLLGSLQAKSRGSEDWPSESRMSSFANTWMSHYNQHQIFTFTSPDLHGERRISNGFESFMEQTATECCYFLAYAQTTPRKDDQRIGEVWFPDDAGTGAFDRDFGWRVNNHLINPFVYNETLFTSMFTEQLRDCKTTTTRATLQAFMPMEFDTDILFSNRENIPIAEQHKTPNSMSDEEQKQQRSWTEQEFQAFGTVRCFPSPQMARNFVKILKTQSVSFVDSDLHQMIRQVLWNLGPIAVKDGVDVQLPDRCSDDYGRRLWREFESNTRNMEDLVNEVVGLLLQYEEKRCDHCAFVMLIDLAVFLLPSSGGLLYTPLLDLAGVCVKITAENKAKCDECLAENGENNKRLRVLMAQHLMYALTAYAGILRADSCEAGGGSTVESSALVGKILHNIALFRDAQAEAPVFPDRNNEWIYDELAEQVKHLLAENLGLVLSLASDEIITRVVEAITGDHFQAGLAWTSSSSGCQRFKLDSVETSIAHAKDETNGTVYSFNIHNGDFLVNGYFRDRLPLTIRENAVYTRAFVDLDFKITRSVDGVYTTTRMFHSSRFEFCEGGSVNGEGNVLICSEVKKISVKKFFAGIAILEPFELRFELLPPTVVSQFLPPYLVECFTHWYCAEYSVILCRSNLDTERFKKTGLLFNDTAFVVNTNGRLTCVPVPVHMVSSFMERADVQTALVNGKLVALIHDETANKDRKQLVCVKQVCNDNHDIES
jgi:hypothetical protein